mgnify:CR=1 FL=1
MTVFSHIPKSTYIKGIEWLSDRIPYPDNSVKGETYPVSRATSGTMAAIFVLAAFPKTVLPEKNPGNGFALLHPHMRQFGVMI